MGYVGKVKDTAGTTHLVGSTLYGTCSTAAGTAAKVVTCSDFSELVTGVTIHVKFTYSNTASNATLNVNSKGAKNLCSHGTTRVGTTERTSWKAGAVVSLTYDGTSWVMNDYIPDTGVTTDTKNTAGSSNSSDPLYLIGAATQSSTGVQTYSNANVTMEDGDLQAVSFNSVTIELLTGGIYIGDVAPGSLGTALYIPSGQDYTLGNACEMNTLIDFDGSTIDHQTVPTSKAVADYVASQAMGAATFQGSLVQTDSGGSSAKWTQAELQTASYKKGWYWVCEVASTPGTASTYYAGNCLEVGDMLFCVSDKGSAYAASDFTAIQNNIETLTTTEIDTLWAAA